MNILYITVGWTGLEEVVFDGKTDANGMPAFIKPLKGLLEHGHSVDMYIIHSHQRAPQVKVVAEWFKKVKIVGMSYYAQPKYERIKNIFNIKREIRNILNSKSYDFVYAHGSAAGVVYKEIIQSGIPYGHRLYGTFLYDEIEKEGYRKAIYKHYIEYSVFKRKKDLLLITDDGSNGDKAFQLINKKRNCDFEFWINGVDAFSCDECKNHWLRNENDPFLFYLARISRWKGQHRAIKLLKILKDNNLILKLYIAGQIVEEDYYKELIALARTLGVEEQVIFTGGIARDEVGTFIRHAIASLSFYDLSNRGNVFYEYLNAGGVVISLADGSLDDFIVNGENGFLVKNIEDAQDIISDLCLNPNRVDIIRERALKTSKLRLKTWTERVNDEIALIEKYARK